MVNTQGLIHWLVFLVTISFLSGCSKGLPPEEEEETPILFDERPAPGATQFTEIVEPFFTQQGNVLFLNSFDTEDPNADISAVLRSDDGITLQLDTEKDNLGEPEFSVLVQNNSVVKLNHATGEARVLNHFTNPICEILSQDIIETTTDAGTGDTEYEVLHADWVYVVTVQGIGTDADPCSDDQRFKQYQRLSLNFQFDATDDNDTLTNSLPSVSEAEARSELVFGWVDDDETVQADDKKLDYGYFGYSFNAEELVFFDKELEPVWTQDREIETFFADGERYPSYLFAVHQLDQTHYLTQIGRDLFVFEASSGLFAQTNLTTDGVLVDRVHKLLPQTLEGQSVISEVEHVVNSDVLLLIDQNSIFAIDYNDGFIAPTVSRQFSVENNINETLDSVAAPSYNGFSQFNLSDCDFADDVTACRDANTPDAISNPAWQFITDCDAGLGCEFAAVDLDDCVTTLTGADDEVFCHVSDYTHLDELDQPANNADFRGYMQYGPEYISRRTYLLDGGSVLINAQMSERNVLLRYHYDVDLLAPKSTREQVLFGDRILHQGMTLHMNTDGLYITSLVANGNERFNECYINGVRAVCDVSNFDIEEEVGICSGLDLQKGRCVNSFKEYESLAMFCTPAELAAETCSDSELIGVNSLSIESDDQDGRWVKVNYFDANSDGGPVERMYILLSDASETVGEGIMQDAQLVEFNVQARAALVAASLGSFESVEGVLDTGLIKDFQNTPGEKLDVARIDVISEERFSEQRSIVDLYYIDAPLQDGQGGAVNVGERIIQSD